MDGFLPSSKFLPFLPSFPPPSFFSSFLPSFLPSRPDGRTDEIKKGGQGDRGTGRRGKREGMKIMEARKKGKGERKGERKGTNDEGQGTRDERQGTRDKGQGTRKRAG